MFVGCFLSKILKPSLYWHSNSPTGNHNNSSSWKEEKLSRDVVNLYMTPDWTDLRILSLKQKQEESRVELLTITLRLENGRRWRKLRIRLFLILHDVVPRNGNTIMNSFFGTVATGIRFSRILSKNTQMHLSTNLEGDHLQIFDFSVQWAIRRGNFISTM